MSTKDSVEKEKEKDVYIIITNSLQNDFLEEDIQDATEYYPNLNYDDCQKLWIECCNEVPMDKSFFKNLMERAKNCAEKSEFDLEKSKEAYLKYIDELEHIVHIDPRQSERLWEDADLGNFIKDLLETGKIVNNNKDAKEKFYLIHIRDWHDPTDALQKKELKHFGDHCIKGTHGAKFIKPLDVYIQNKDYYSFNTVINTNSLSSFSETNLEKVLEHIMAVEKSSRSEVKIGILGVVTDIKILLLTYELTVGHKFEKVFVCGDLCAGFTQKRHNDGINYIKNVLGVEVYNQGMFRNEFHIQKLNY